VDVDVADAELLALLQVPVAPRVGELVALGVAAPLGRVELDALELPALGERLQLVQPGLAVTRVERPVGDELVGVPLRDGAALLGRVETVDVPVGEVRRLEDGAVDVPDLEEVVDHLLLGVPLELLERDLVLLGRKVAVVVVEALDEALAVPVELVGRAPVPEVDVSVDDEVVDPVLAVHE
jgi:hypothetical protein